MFSTFLRPLSSYLTTTNFSFSTITPLTVLKDIEYVKLIESSTPLEAYNILLESHFNKVVLDTHSFRTVYNKTQHLDQTYHHVLLNIYNQYFNNLTSIQPLLKRLNKETLTISESTNKQNDLRQKISEYNTSILNTEKSQTATSKSNPILKEIIQAIKIAGQSRSGLILNNVQIQFDYKYMYGNPLANQGLQEYDQQNQSSPEVDPNDILSCMKSIKIGQIQLVSPKSNVQV